MSFEHNNPEIQPFRFSSYQLVRPLHLLTDEAELSEGMEQVADYLADDPEVFPFKTPVLTLVQTGTLAFGISRGLLTSPEQIQSKLENIERTVGTTALNGTAMSASTKAFSRRNYIVLNFDDATNDKIDAEKAKVEEELGVALRRNLRPLIPIANATPEYARIVVYGLNHFLPAPIKFERTVRVPAYVRLDLKTENERIFAENNSARRVYK